MDYNDEPFDATDMLDWNDPIPQEYLNGKPILITEPEKNSKHLKIREVRFCRQTAEIEFLGEGGHRFYGIDLERAKTAKDWAFWLHHIQEKGWGTPQVVGAAVTIMGEVLLEATGKTFAHHYCHQNGFDWTAWLAKDATR